MRDQSSKHNDHAGGLQESKDAGPSSFSFQEGLVANSFAVGDLTGLCDIGFRQTEGNLHAGPSSQFRNQA